MIVYHLIEIHLDEPLYLTDDDAAHEKDSISYLSGVIHSIPTFQQSSRIAENEVKIELFDSDGSITAAFLADEWRNRKYTVTRVIEDGSESTERIIAQKLMTGFEYTQGDMQAELIISSINPEALDIPRGTKSNSHSHHQLDPTDNIFDSTPFIQDNIPWGISGAPNGGSSSGGSGGGSGGGDGGGYQPY